MVIAYLNRKGICCYDKYLPSTIHSNTFGGTGRHLSQALINVGSVLLYFITLFTVDPSGTYNKITITSINKKQK